MKIETSFPIAAVSGRLGDSDVVIVKRGNKCYARKYSPPKNPQTADQVAVRRFLANATKAWSSLTVRQREGWAEYARRYSFSTFGQELNPYNMFSKVQYYRQALGMGLLLDPPTLAPPPRPAAIIQRPAATAEEFRFVLQHSIAKRDDYVVTFEITPAMPSTGRKPRSIEFRMIRHVGPASFFALLAPSHPYIISGARFEVNHGQRYGVRARIVTAEGVPGEVLETDFVKVIQWGLRPNRPDEADAEVETDLFSIQAETPSGSPERKDS